MRDYNEMSCTELRCNLNRINNTFRNFPNMSEEEKIRLNREYWDIHAVLTAKLFAIIEEG
jgi:hypothetical protein